MSKVSSKQEALREKLLAETIAALDQYGVAGVKARELASLSSCSVGTIYNLFGDLDNLIISACALTLQEYRSFVEGIYRKSLSDSNESLDHLLNLAGAYFDFACLYPKRWQANFELTIDPASDYYRIYTEQHNALLQIIVAELEKIAPSKDGRQLLAVGRALWGAVHGITVLAMANPEKKIPREKVLTQCALIVEPVVENLRRETGRG